MFICYITHIIIYHWMIVWFATPLLPSRRPAGIARLQCRSNWKPCMARERRQGMTARDETPQVLFVFWHAVLVLYYVISFIFLTYIYVYVLSFLTVLFFFQYVFPRVLFPCVYTKSLLVIFSTATHPMIFFGSFFIPLGSNPSLMVPLKYDPPIGCAS